MRTFHTQELSEDILKNHRSDSNVVWCQSEAIRDVLKNSLDTC